MPNDIISGSRRLPDEYESQFRDGHIDGPLVVFIAGAGRSGSTLLGDVIGQMPGGFHAGEMRFILEQVDDRDRVCGCGRPLRECDLWQAVRGQAFGPGSPQFDLNELTRFSQEELGYRPRSWLKLRRQARLSVPLGASAEHYALALRSLYLAIANVTGAEMIVDSSKAAMHVYLGMHSTGLRTHVLHLVRDPRAIAYSWRRRNIDKVITYGPTRVAVNWVASNLAVQALNDHASNSSYTLVRYEDFVREPKSTLEAISNQIGLGYSSFPFINATTLRMEANHTVAGNPSRFKSGDVQLSPDEEWRSRMSTRDRVLATLPATALLRRYAYPLRAR